ncbi:MAG: hypothetical protein ACYSWX_02610 [Planctomycetota bacterium]|jgi:hypothetical protein
MKHLKLAATTVASLALAAGANAQQIDLVAAESFNYNAGDPIDGQVGGENNGWFQQWFAGGAGVIEVPGLDGIGGAANTNGNNAGAFRQPKTGPWIQTVASGFNFGGGDGSMYVSFTAQRPAGSTSQYAGLSLHTSFVGEKLFLGSPFASNEWGIGDPILGQGASVAGSDVTQATRIVVRMDYQPGDERCRMWLNPSEAFPTSGADLDLTVGDHTWNEVRLQAGEPSDGSNTGWLFDDIQIHCVDCVTNDFSTDTNSINAILGGTANFEVFAGLDKEGDLYQVVGTLSGTSPGLPLGPGILLPINFDALTSLTINDPNGIGLTNGFGTLDLDGRAFPNFTLPSGITAASGLTVSFAYVVIDSTAFTITKASQAVSISLL